ncbi:hypothetical protein J6590_090534 [Homalodisca vitripennis]|nr:hypothetical protein J6590_090534 [Homalodisca vitripennis]
MLHNTEDHVMVITRPLLRDVAQRRSVTVDHIIVSLEDFLQLTRSLIFRFIRLRGFSVPRILTNLVLRKLQISGKSQNFPVAKLWCLAGPGILQIFLASALSSPLDATHFGVVGCNIFGSALCPIQDINTPSKAFIYLVEDLAKFLKFIRNVFKTV